MEKIPARERFSKHARTSEVSPELLKEAIYKFDLPYEDCLIRLLPGGFMNANFAVCCREKKFVFRVYSSDRVTAERERDVLQFLRSYPVKAPKALGLFEVQDRPTAVLEYFDGISFEDKILSQQPISPRLYENIGTELGQIHQIHFTEAGFIGPGMTIGREYEDFGLFIRRFIDKTLNEVSAERLDSESKERLKQLVRDKWHLVYQTEPLRQLVHTDFNPKNILVSKGPETTVLAIIDWEFCLSGNGLIDFGNFFRFSYDYSPDAHVHFEKGYRSVNSRLALEWKDASRLLDLGNMCSFLERHEDYPESFRTARAVINATLHHFGY